MIRPLTRAESGSKPSTASDVADFPDPDSPTSPSVSAAPTSKLTLFTATLSPNCMQRSDIWSSGVGTDLILDANPFDLPGRALNSRQRLIWDDMWRTLLSALLLGSVLPLLPASAQMHKVSRPEQVVRAVGVYEWTGDLKKPDASRLIPVTVFINGTLEDAGVYLPRPIPFALTPGNQYILQQAGIDRGTLDLAYARHLQTADSAYEDGWFGYGSYKAPSAPKKDPALHASRTPAVLTSSKDDDRPHLNRKDDTAKAGTTDQTKDSANTSDPADASQKKTTGDSTADDPDRPTMRRRSESSSTPTDTSTTNTPDPANDPDRPTLRRRSPDDAKKKPANDVATVTGTGSLNDDPDRPKLQHGARSSNNDTDIPKLTGVPNDLKQMVAVSDPANRPPHDFSRPWSDENERSAVMAKMRSLARTQLQAYAADPANKPLSSTLPSTTPKASAANRAAARPARSSAKVTSKPAAPPETPLLDEDLKAYTLSYGGAPTYIYSAHTGGTGPDLRYVTVVAQAEVSGELRTAVKSATDEAHLDRTPRMRFVDAVDVEASNRASLLFELRGHSERQFALYRVIGARADTLFTTGTTQ